MARFEYKVIPAPAKGAKAPGVKAGEARFANTIEALLNTQAAEGWEYMRTDILPSDERQGLTGSQTIYRTLMVFRREKAEENAADDMIAAAQDIAEAAHPEPEQPPASKPKPAPVVELTRRDPPKTPDVTPDAPPRTPPETPSKD